MRALPNEIRLFSQIKYFARFSQPKCPQSRAVSIQNSRRAEGGAGSRRRGSSTEGHFLALQRTEAYLSDEALNREFVELIESIENDREFVRSIGEPQWAKA